MIFTTSTLYGVFIIMIPSICTKAETSALSRGKYYNTHERFPQKMADCNVTDWISATERFQRKAVSEKTPRCL